MIGPPLAPDDYPPGAATFLALMDALGIGGGTLHRVAEGGEGGDITDPVVIQWAATGTTGDARSVAPGGTDR